MQKFIELLESQLGYSEKSGGYTKFGDWYGSNVEFDADYSAAPWCDMYLSWAAKKLGYEDWMGQFAYTVYHARWFQQQGAWGTTPKPGAIVFFDWGGSRQLKKIDHIGVVTRVEGRTIHTIEGNIDGGVAKRKKRDTAKVVGYGYPEKVKARLEKEAARQREIITADTPADNSVTLGLGPSLLSMVSAPVRETDLPASPVQAKAAARHAKPAADSSATSSTPSRAPSEGGRTAGPARRTLQRPSRPPPRPRVPPAVPASTPNPPPRTPTRSPLPPRSPSATTFPSTSHSWPPPPSSRRSCSPRPRSSPTPGSGSRGHGPRSPVRAARSPARPAGPRGAAGSSRTCPSSPRSAAPPLGPSPRPRSHRPRRPGSPRSRPRSPTSRSPVRTGSSTPVTPCRTASRPCRAAGATPGDPCPAIGATTALACLTRAGAAFTSALWLSPPLLSRTLPYVAGVTAGPSPW